jgi:hypothetical protein
MRQARNETDDFRRFVETWQAETHPVDYLREVWQLHQEQGCPADGPAHAVEKVSAAGMACLIEANAQTSEEALIAADCAGIVYVFRRDDAADPNKFFCRPSEGV